MQVILDEQSVEQNPGAVRYGGFWVRFLAVLLDGIILAPISFGIGYFNVISWKSIPLLILVTLAGLAYKPVMEHLYGATLGKMALRLQVVSGRFDKAEFSAILLRNIFNILPGLISLAVSIQIYSDPGFEEISGFQEFAAFGNQFAANQAMSLINFAIMLIDSIMLGVDEQKRSLHDRIAGTYVIEKP